MKAGLVGLGVMGRNLTLNLRDKGHTIIATDTWESARAWSPPGLAIVTDHAALVTQLETPRIVMLMVKAGRQVDVEIANLVPHLEAGDVLIDGGNSYYKDTERRGAELAERGIGYLGVGVSGGAAGARHGPAMMVGGRRDDWETVAPLLSSAAALYDGEHPTVGYFGAGGAGHFVKMVHNGIEYAIMQAIAECHTLLRDGAGLDPDAIHAIFKRWSTTGPGAGFLLEITAEIVNAHDALTGGNLLDLIDDTAGQKGTGGWTAEAAIAFGVPATTILEALCARQISGETASRTRLASMVTRKRTATFDAHIADMLEQALAAAMVVAISQGLQIYAAAAVTHGWRPDLGEVLRAWRAGSILRMTMLDDLAAAFDAAPTTTNGLALPPLAQRIADALPAWRQVVSLATGCGLPVPVLAAGLSTVESLATARLPTALIQAQRDRFGAHGFRRTDRPGDHHGPWVHPDAEADT